MNASLASRIRFLVLVVCVGFGASVLSAYYILTQRQIADTVSGDSQTASAMLGTMIKGRGDLLAALTTFVATEPHVRDLALTDRATVTEEIASLKRQAGVDALAMTNREGALLGEVGLTGHGTLAKADTASTEALRGYPWRGVIDRDGGLMVAASAPLRVGAYIQGALVAYLRLDGARAKEISRAGAVEIAFIHDGKVTAGSTQFDGLRVQTADDSWRTSIGGRDYVARYAPLPGAAPGDHMGFVVLRPVEAIIGPYRQFSVTFMSVLGIVCVVTLGAGSAFGSNIVRSLGDLVAAARRMQLGEWPEELVVRRNDEIGTLQAAFNGMAVSVRESEARLLAMIDHDPLTELDNHRRFKERLEYEAARTTANGETLALLLIDIDEFSQFNEAQGHAAGDLILKQVAAAIKESAPELAEVARYGGEEFAIVIPRGTVLDAKALFAQIQAEVADVTVSGGCAELSSAKGKTDGLVVAAELALACAKQSGRNQVRDFETVPGYDSEDPAGVYRALQDGTYATIKALAAAVDAKDPYTHGHSERVARYAADLAAYVGADARVVDLVLRAGTLHDVGKIGVPDAVLQKPGRLDDEENRVMQAHPVLGELIVAKVPQLAELLPGIRHHHERFDGKGYPDRLAGPDIPRVARFLAIADSFDAMTSDRPYRKGMPWETALSEIERGAGTQFDPDLVPPFLALMGAGLAKAA
ncbi:MAG: HD domain-containing phosphohydrolase [Fimbriimonadaceae bacterium]